MQRVDSGIGVPMLKGACSNAYLNHSHNVEMKYIGRNWPVLAYMQSPFYYETKGRASFERREPVRLQQHPITMTEHGIWRGIKCRGASVREEPPNLTGGNVRTQTLHYPTLARSMQYSKIDLLFL